MSDTLELEFLCKKLQADLEIKDRKYLLKTHKDCWLGSDAVSWFLNKNIVISEGDAILLGQQLIDQGYIYHVTRDAQFENRNYFYRFTSQDNKGKVAVDSKGSEISWSSASKFLPSVSSDVDAKNTAYNSSVLTDEEEQLNTSKLLTEIEVSPLDKHNVQLLDNVHPASWQDPKVDGEYTMVVLGAGAGGLISSASAAGIGAKVALIEEHLMGGDCLNIGCVPSKALIRAARAVKEVQNASQFGVHVNGTVEVNFGKIMERLRRIRAEISKNDSAKRYSRDLKVEIFQGRGRFISKNQIEVNGQTLTFRKAVIATGGSAALPKIAGLKEAPYLTNATVFNLTELPPRVCVIGAGPIGLELAQSFARFGSKVTCFIRGTKLLPKEDRDAAEVVHRALIEDGVELFFETEYVQVSHTSTDSTSKYNAPFPNIQIDVRIKDDPKSFECEALIIATGRKPNVENMGLELAEVSYDTRKGVHVNEYLQTTNKNIYAVGDVCTRFQFTHVADFMARTVVRNALFFGRGKQSALLIPWATYTEPEVAHVGLYESDMKSRGIPFDTYTKHFDDIDRAICDGDTEGFVKIHCRKGTDEIIGATIVNPTAGNMISELTMAMQCKIGLGTVANIIHPYPTQAEAVRMCGDLFNRTRLTPVVKGLLSSIANRSIG